MREVLAELMTLVAAGETVGVGTVVATFRSAPRPARCLDAGRAPAARRSARVSGGCVEGAVYELAPVRGRRAATPCSSGTASATTTRSRSG